MLILFLGEMGKKLFETFKKRYLKKKAAWKKANRSGTSTAAVGKAQNAYGLYKFFHWYDDFQRPRSVTTNSNARQRNRRNVNLGDLANSINSSSDEEGPTEAGSPANMNKDEDENEVEDADDMEDNPIHGNDRDSDFGNDASDDQILIPKKKERKNSAKPVKKMSKREAESNTDILIGDLAKSIKNRRSAQQVDKANKDAEDLFGTAIALELCKMSDHVQVLAKSEIYQVIFKYQMMTYNNTNGNQQAQNNSENNVHNFSQLNSLTSGSQSGSSFSGNMSFFSRQPTFPMSNAINSAPSTPTNMDSGLSQASSVYNMTSPAC